MQLPYAIRARGQRLLGGVPVRILSGPNRGMRWSAAALGRGYGAGTFGRDRLDALQAVTRAGDSFWDVGAHKGFMTLAAARMVGPSGEVVAVEPSETNLRIPVQAVHRFRSNPSTRSGARRPPIPVMSSCHSGAFRPPLSEGGAG